MDRMLYTVDRLSDGVAVLIGDDGTAYEIDAGRLPAGAGEGAVLRSHLDEFQLDEGERQHRADRIRSKLQALRDR
ncbi:DUF3006 domain-containing protein [Fodinicurvata sp. EGI_FJ10296]|uniref:DUF3006 domain-containing protein n=1 Tax=Fodinicurvata sp. EGI_FJ10296 TaxID=3231908 RepID=UPI00345398E9